MLLRVVGPASGLSLSSAGLEFPRSSAQGGRIPFVAAPYICPLVCVCVYVYVQVAIRIIDNNNILIWH